jgi:Superinfection immunity protein
MLPFGMLIYGVGLLFYFIPAGVAAFREHHNFGAIFMLNLLLGWTFVGWVVALVWACTETFPRGRPHGDLPPRWSAEYDKARGVDEPSRW